MAFCDGSYGRTALKNLASEPCVFDKALKPISPPRRTLVRLSGWDQFLSSKIFLVRMAFCDGSYGRTALKNLASEPCVFDKALKPISPPRRTLVRLTGWDQFLSSKIFLVRMACCDGSYGRASSRRSSSECCLEMTENAHCNAAFFADRRTEILNLFQKILNLFSIS